MSTKLISAAGSRRYTGEPGGARGAEGAMGAGGTVDGQGGARGAGKGPGGRGGPGGQSQAMGLWGMRLAVGSGGGRGGRGSANALCSCDAGGFSEAHFWYKMCPPHHRAILGGPQRLV